MIDARTLNNAWCKMLLVDTQYIFVLFKNFSHGFKDNENLNLIL